MQINGVINKVNPLKSPLVINGGKTRTVNGLRHVDYDKWRMNWNGNHFAPPIVGCVLYLPGVPGFGSTIFDHSGSGNNGTLGATTTAPTWTRASNGLWYLSFDGGDEVNITHSASLDITTGNFSVALWYKGNDTDKYVAGKYDGSTNWLVRVDNAPNVWQLNCNDSVNSITANGTTARGNIWRLLVGTRDDDNLICYTNAVAGTPVEDTSGDISNAATVDIGKVGALGAMICSVALFRFYNRALSATEIAGIYNQERHLFGV